MGSQGPWLAVSGEHDAPTGTATIVFAHARRTTNPARRAPHPAHCSSRNEPFAGIAPSYAFYDELELAPGDTLTGATGRRGRRRVGAGGDRPSTWRRGRGEHICGEHGGR